MKIEIWSDYVCPFCYIGKRKLEEALENFPHKDDVEVTYKSYELDPNAPLYDGQDYYETLAKKFGSVDQVKQMTSNVKEQANLVGLDFQFNTMKQTNTFDAHRLAKYAETKGKGNDISEKLLSAHFIESKDVGNKEELGNIAASVGLKKEDAMEVLQDEQAFRAEVENDLNEAKQFQITGVPFFIINRKYAISGAQPTETFSQALQQVWEEENAATPLQTFGSDDDTCGPEGCDIPENK